MNHLINSVRLASSSKLQKKLFLQSSFVRMTSQYLINDPKYSFLKDLGLNERNHGVFATHGQWFGNGEVCKLFNSSFVLHATPT
jgi:aldehyde dehydrogenase family 7 protein A1